LVFEQIKNVLDTGQSFHTKNTPLDLIVEGEIHTYYFNYSLTPLYDVKGKVYAVMNTGVDLTDLNLAKKRIEESDKRFRNTVKQAPVGITILRGPNHVVEMANEAYLDLVDIRETEFVGRPIFESMPEAEGAVGSLLNNVFKTGIPYHGNEMPITIKRYGKEEVSYFDFLYHPLKEEDEKISGIIVTVTEVTEKVEARKKTEQNEQRLNIIVDASELGTWELNVITKEVQYSKRFFEIICGSQDEENLCHEQLVKHIHPDDLHIREEAFKKSITSGYLHYEARVIWKDQSIHWVEAKGKVFYDKENKPEKLLGTLRDITDERCHQQELEESEQKFRLLANSMPQHIWTSDTEGNLNYFNQSVYNYTGLTREQIDKTGWLQIVHPNDREENIKLWMDAIATGKDFLFEHRFRRHDGEYRWQLSRAIPQIDENGKIQMWVGSSTDIQEQKIFTNELEKQVSERTKQLEQNNIDLEKINKELQSFAYISSHDLQEPLRKIQTFATQIMDRESQNLSENGKDKFKRMQGAAQRMQALINDLLAYSKTNIQERKFEKTDLNKIIDDVKEDLRDDLEQKHINIEIDEICEVNVIPFQFRQLIYNLVSNSIKFSKPDIALIIKIKCKIAKGETLKNKLLSHEKEYCYISIADNGIGFDQEYSKKIFELFQRLHGRSEYAGTGIGLAIVKKIVENHNGFIIAEGELNKGATFDIYFPTT
jgi:PAS domain S-box-containing protein